MLRRRAFDLGSRLELVADHLGTGAVRQADIPDEQGDLVLRVQGLPQLGGQVLRRGGVQSHPHRLPLEGGQGIPIPLIGVEEAALAGQGCVIEVEVPAAAGRVPVGAL